jgi:hypothetical protein
MVDPTNAVESWLNKALIKLANRFIKMKLFKVNFLIITVKYLK